MNTCTLPVSEISVDPDLQPRTEGIDQDHVGELELVPEHWPPLKVVKRGNQYLLVDGFHRLAAAKNLRLEKVPAEILRVPDDGDLHALAFQLNASHGRALTLNDRRAFAARLLEDNPEWSNREIGRRSGLAQATVAKLRQELEDEARIAEATTRVGRDGRSYSVKQDRSQGTTTFDQVLDNILTAADTTGRRRFVRYLQRLAEVLDEQWDLDSFDTAQDAAKACLAVLGEEEARDFAEQLGCSAANVLDIAFALGYSEDKAP